MLDRRHPYHSPPGALPVFKKSLALTLKPHQPLLSMGHRHDLARSRCSPIFEHSYHFN